MPNENINPDQTPVNLDEIEPASAGAPENGGEEPVDCEDSPTGKHEFDELEDGTSGCVYCGKDKDS